MLAKVIWVKTFHNISHFVYFYPIGGPRKDRVTKSKRAGLEFPVGRIHKVLKKGEKIIAKHTKFFEQR